MFLFKYLGYQDMNHLSQMSPLRRKEVFSLSQPGECVYLCQVYPVVVSMNKINRYRGLFFAKTDGISKFIN